MADTITKEELEDLMRSGAEVEIEPQVLVIQGLMEQLEKLTPAKTDNSDIVAAIRELVEKLNTEVSVKCEPVVESTHHSHNENKIVVDTKPILEAVERLTKKNDYHFTITRNNRGQIESMDARIVDISITDS
jgi:tRNA(Ile2) C34 agmatinyltransferase TiaS